MSKATTTNYIIDRIPADSVEEFLSIMRSFHKKSGCRFRYKKDGRTTQQVYEFPLAD